MVGQAHAGAHVEPTPERHGGPAAVSKPTPEPTRSPRGAHAPGYAEPTPEQEPEPTPEPIC